MKANDERLLDELENLASVVSDLWGDRANDRYTWKTTEVSDLERAKILYNLRIAKIQVGVAYSKINSLFTSYTEDLEAMARGEN